MRPIPVLFHIGPLQVHTYGIGLALTFWFAFNYFERRLRRNGYRTDWFVSVFLWIVLAAVVGARALHVLSNLSYYDHNPSQVLAIWHGGLSSFGGLLFAVPTGIVLTRRRCPELPIGRALDIIAPVLLAAWAMGRSSWRPAGVTPLTSGSACTTPIRWAAVSRYPSSRPSRTSASTWSSSPLNAAWRAGLTARPVRASPPAPSSGRPWCSGA